MALQIKRGTNSQRQALLLAQGEPFFVTDYASLGVSPMWIGDGTTYGGITSVSPVTFNELNDITITTPTEKQLLQYQVNTGQWINSNSLTLNASGNLTVDGGNSLFRNYASTASSINNIQVPVTVESDSAYNIAYTSISGGSQITVAGTALPTLATGTRVLVDNIGTFTQITALTSYYVFASGSSSFKLATTPANAAAGVGIAGGGQSAGTGTAYIAVGTGFGVGQDTIVKSSTLNADSKTVMRTAAVATNTTPGAEEYDYNIYLMTGGALASTPQFKVSSTGQFSFGGDLTVPGDITVTGGDITTGSTTTGRLFNTTTGRVDIAGSAATVYIGSDSGSNLIKGNTTTIGSVLVVGNNGLVVQTSGDTAIASTTQSTTATTGSLTTLGGVGIAKNLYVGGATVIAGDLTVNGTTTTINSTTISVDDKNIELGSIGSPTDATATGGGITLRGTTDKTILWNSDSTGNWIYNAGITTPEVIAGNISIAAGTNNNTITTTSGDLILAAASGSTIQFSNDASFNGSLRANTITNASNSSNYITIDSTGLTTSHNLTVMGNQIRSNNGSVIQPAITLAGPDVITAGNLTATGNLTLGNQTIRSANGTTAITVADTSGNVIVAGDIIIGGNDIRSSGGTTAITLSNANATIAGNLTLSNNILKAADGSTAITLSTGGAVETAYNLNVAGDLTVSGNDIRSSSATAITMAGADVAVAGSLTFNATGSNGALMNTGTINLYAGTSQTIDSYSITAYGTVKYLVEARCSGHGTQVFECITFNDNNSQAYITVYGDMRTGSANLVNNIAVTVVSGQVNLKVDTAFSTTYYKFIRTCM